MVQMADASKAIWNFCKNAKVSGSNGSHVLVLFQMIQNANGPKTGLELLQNIPKQIWIICNTVFAIDPKILEHLQFVYPKYLKRL